MDILYFLATYIIAHRVIVEFIQHDIVSFVDITKKEMTLSNALSSVFVVRSNKNSIYIS